MSIPPRSKTLRRIVLSVALTLAAHVAAVAAVESFDIRDASRAYDLRVSVEACGGEKQNNDQNTCSGKASIRIYRKGAKAPFQTLSLPNIEIYRDTLAHNPETSAKPRGLYAEEYGFIFDDFDFDGSEDLAVCNGRESGYGGPSYTVFLFNRRSNKFAENRKMSELAAGVNLGLFFVDAKKKQLVAYSKSGCCYHETDKYKVVGGSPVLVEKIVEDATGGTGFVVITTKRRVGVRWITRVRKEKMNEEN